MIARRTGDMGNPDVLLTTRQYSELTGISVASVSKLLRQGKLKGQKNKGKWLIPESEVDKKILEKKSNVKKTVSGLKGTMDSKPEKSLFYSIEAFSKMTYLTPLGVEKWLKAGKLTGEKDTGNIWKVSSKNLDKTFMKNLIRK